VTAAERKIQELTNKLQATETLLAQAKQGYALQSQKVGQLQSELNMRVMSAQLYNVIITEVERNEGLRESWTDFLMIFKLAVPGSEEKFKEVLKYYKR
jgi:hypothetical protein